MAHTVAIPKDVYKQLKSARPGGSVRVRRGGHLTTGKCEVTSGGHNKPIACHVKEDGDEHFLVVRS